MTEPQATAVHEAYEVCRRVTAARARSFYLGLRLAPQPERSALYALYAWNRMGDDIVDETSTPREARAARLEAFAESTRALYQNAGTAHAPLWMAMTDVLERFPIDSVWLEAMLHGLRRDLDHEQPRTLNDLDLYCDEVAGSVGRCCVAVWGVRSSDDDHAVYRLAGCLGRAFQLTNVLRDIGEDAELDPSRCYIPRSMLESRGLSIGDMLDWKDPPACRALVLEIADEARRSYAAGEELLTHIRPRFRPTLWAMHRVYERTLSLIERDPRRSVRANHIRPSRVAAMSIACRAFAMSAMASGRR